MSKLIQMGVLLGTLFFVLGMVQSKQSQRNTLPQQHVSYSLSISGIQNVLSAVGKTNKDQDVEQSKHPIIRTAILPHHTDIATHIDRYWVELATYNTPEVIVIVSPAHWDQGDGLMQTTFGSWHTPFGSVQTDDTFIRQLKKKTAIFVQPDSFENEHGIAVQIPYIAHYFPDVPIVPIIATSKAGVQEAQQLVDAIERTKKQVLLLASIDFAHYLALDVSLQHDEETRAAMLRKDFDTIDAMKSEHLDSSFAFDVYLLWQQRTSCVSKERWHAHNAQLFAGVVPQQGTSYFVFFCYEKPVVEVTAVGDLMLSRAVGRALEPRATDISVQQRLNRTEQLLQSVASGTDILFGNLESVLADTGVPLTKSIVFQASPDVVEVLKQFGFTHLSVTNNHTEDYGKEAWAQSVEILKQNGLEPIGGFANETDVVTTKMSGKTIGFLAFQNLTYPLQISPVLQAVKNAKQTHDYVIVSMHWGIEYQPNPSPEQILLGHALIDAGADAVIGHHPHVQQPYERYHGKPIFYSLGNFIFDQQGDEQNKSMIATVQFWDDADPTVFTTPVGIDKYFPR